MELWWNGVDGEMMGGLNIKKKNIYKNSVRTEQ